MQARLLVVGVVAAVLATASGCGGSDEPSSPPMSEISISCPQFADTAERITQAQTELYTGSGGAEAVDELVGELDALKDGAPDDVRAALTELGTAFRQAQELLANPSTEQAAELAKVTGTLAEAGKTVTDYVVSHCD